MTEGEYPMVQNIWRGYWEEEEYIRVEAGWFRILALGLHSWVVPGRYLNVTAPFAVGKMARCVPVTEPYKCVLLSQEKVESRGFVRNGNSSDLSSQDVLPETSF